MIQITKRFFHFANLTVLVFGLFLVSAMPAFSEETTESFFVQFAGTDLDTIERSIQDALARAPVSGETREPITSPYTFGTLTARGVHYAFAPQIHHTQLFDGGFRFELSIRNFQGRIDRLELNKSGSRSCTNMVIKSPRNDIPVSVVVSPKISSTGALELAVNHASFDLNEDNFKVEYPEKCHVLFGFNWLIRWTLPWIIESYKNTIEGALGDALAKGISSRTAELSPLLALNITLPFEQENAPSFYATVGVRPFNLNITPARVRSSFATSINIDPDEIQPFAEGSSSWPNDVSFLGISWNFLNGLFKEAQAKGVIKVLITKGESRRDEWLTHALWTNVWPDFSKLVPSDEELQLSLLGGKTYHWTNGEISEHQASLFVDDLKIRLQSKSRVFADFQVGVNVRFGLLTDDHGNLSASLQEVILGQLHLLTDSGAASLLPLAPTALTFLQGRIQTAMNELPPQNRDLFKIQIPRINIGNHQIQVQEITPSPSGIMFPLRYVAPDLDPN